MAGTFIEEYNDLVGRISAIYDVVSALGATDPMPDTRDTWHLSSYIQSIEPAPIQDDWCLPYGWPDLRKVIDDDPFKDTQNVVKRTALLIEVDTEDNLPEVYGLSGLTKGALPLYSTVQSGVGFRTSNDPDTWNNHPTSAINTIIDWDPSKFLDGANGQKFVWVEIYQSKATSDFGWSTGYARLCDSWLGLCWIHGDGISPFKGNVAFAASLKAITGFTFYLAGDTVGYSGLETMPPLSTVTKDKNLADFFTSVPIRKINFAEGGYPLSSTSLTRFANSSSLETLPDLFFVGNKINIAVYALDSANRMKEYPDVMDFSAITQYNTRIWQDIWPLRANPTKMPTRTIWPV